MTDPILLGGIDKVICAECGRPIAPGRPPGTWVHKPGIVAACDLDSDHPAVPESAPC